MQTQAQDIIAQLKSGRSFAGGLKENNKVAPRSKMFTESYFGMAAQDICKAMVGLHNKQIGPLGWPCPSGGSVAVQITTSGALDEATHNCMVFYAPVLVYSTFANGVVNWQSKERMVQLVTGKCLEDQFLEMQIRPLDLSELAFCIQAKFPIQELNANLAAERLPAVRAALRGVAAIVSSGDDVGVHSPLGGIVQEKWASGSPADGLAYDLVVFAAPHFRNA